VRLLVTALPVALMPAGLLILGRADPVGPRPPVLGHAGEEKGAHTPPNPAVVSGEVPLADPHFWSSQN